MPGMDTDVQPQHADLRRMQTVDGNEAVAAVAHRSSEVIAIYPITPSSAMGELADEWSSLGRHNLWGAVPDVVEMQSEGGAAGALHGALQSGALCTTFTASQGLLLMIPNMFKIAGELTPFVMHVAARAVATHALSIFGDHSDVMAARTTGFAMLCSSSVQEAQDLALVAHAATLETRVPFLHFFDGFRTSHEVAKIEALADSDLRALIDDRLVRAHRARALSPEHPLLRGSAQNPDVFFQAREASNPFYLATPDAVQATMDRLGERTGRAYHLFDYAGHPEAERVLVMMGSGCGAAEEAVDALVARGERVGLVKVRLFRPFATGALLAALPETTRALMVLDRTKEPGARRRAALPGRRDGDRGGDRGRTVAAARGHATACSARGTASSSKEFTPAMAKAALDALDDPGAPQHSTVGIVDDVTNASLSVDPTFDTEREETVRAVFYGLGSDGTVSANKNSIKIIGERTDLHAQGYFVYDSKKAGAITVSHLRFGPTPIRSSYQIRRASFVACHQFERLERTDVLAVAAPGATFLLNSPHRPRGCLGASAVRDPAAHRGARHPLLRRRRLRRREGGGPRAAREHGAADVLLRARRRHADRRGDPGDQGRDREDVRTTRGDGAHPQLRRGRRRPRRLARGGGAGRARRRRGSLDASAGACGGTRLRPARDRPHDRG